jgi:hypothetical protein
MNENGDRVMGWDLEGLTVEGMYLGSIPVCGRVDLSRVKYGGGVSHHIALETPIEVYSAIRERVILDHENITRVMGSV